MLAGLKSLDLIGLNTQLAIMLGETTGLRELPEYFKEIAPTIEIGDNLKIDLIGRQALISLKMYAATPSYSKHTMDISKLRPSKKEIFESIRFVMSIDATEPRKDDLRIVLKTLGFDFNGIYKST